MKTGDFVRKFGPEIEDLIFRGASEQAVMSLIKNLLEKNEELCKKVSLYYKGFLDAVNETRRRMLSQHQSNQISKKMTESAIMKIQAEPVDSRF